MIGIKDQYVFIFSIGGEKDFIVTDDLETFRVIEEAGNKLPTFELIFFSKEESVLAKLNEGNTLQVSYGRNLSEMTDTFLHITSINFTKTGDFKRRVQLTGILAKVAYLINPKKWVSDKMSAAEVMAITAGEHFAYETNVGASVDKQNWIQPNIAAKHFVNHLWTHMYLPGSFPIIGITAGGKFIMRDAAAHFGGGHKWRFTPRKQAGNDIVYEGDFSMSSNSGFLNSWAGYEKTQKLNLIEEGLTEIHEQGVSPLMALSGVLHRASSIAKRAENSAYLNENVDPMYWDAYLRNLQSLAIFSSFKITLSYENKLYNTDVLDLVMFLDEMTTTKSQSSEYYSGLYVLTKVQRILSASRLVTVCEMCRESFNSPSGGLR